MNAAPRKKGIFSLQRRIQILVATSLVVAMFILITGVWVLTHILYHDEEVETTDFAAHLVEMIGQEGAAFTISGNPQEDLDFLLGKNPDGWYYYEDETQVISSSPDVPKFKGGLIGGPAELVVAGEDSVHCSVWQSRFRFESSEGKALVVRGNCGADTYYVEVAGITAGYPFLSHLWHNVRRTYISEESLKRTVLPTVVIALITIALITLLFGTLMRRVEVVSAAASQIGKGKHHVRLPEENLPKEILPMVEAINRAIARLEAASEQQALFVAAAAHELRTPMTVFRTRLEQMDESELKGELVEDLKRVDTMVTQLLALAKLGASDLGLEKLDLIDVVQTTCRERGGAVFVAGKELEFEANGDSARIFGDRESIKTAVANLIDNALMFTPEGKTVRVGVDGNRVAVMDEGPGVPEAEKDRIFEPFFKHPPNKPGHGLGLAIVSEIMRIHEGSASARNAEDGGAIFELVFKKAA